MLRIHLTKAKIHIQSFCRYSNKRFTMIYAVLEHSNDNFYAPYVHRWLLEMFHPLPPLERVLFAGNRCYSPKCLFESSSSPEARHKKSVVVDAMTPMSRKQSLSGTRLCRLCPGSVVMVLTFWTSPHCWTMNNRVPWITALLLPSGRRKEGGGEEGWGPRQEPLKNFCNVGRA